MGNARWKGADAYLEGKPRWSNPYPLGSHDYQIWNEGWDEASTEKLEEPDSIEEQLQNRDVPQ